MEAGREDRMNSFARNLECSLTSLHLRLSHAQPDHAGDPEEESTDNRTSEGS